MEDEWIDYYSDITNLEDYYEIFDNKNPTRGFVKRKFVYWLKYHKDLKQKDPKYWKFFYKNKIDPEILAYDYLTEEEKKIILN